MFVPATDVFGVAPNAILPLFVPLSITNVEVAKSKVSDFIVIEFALASNLIKLSVFPNNKKSPVPSM